LATLAAAGEELEPAAAAIEALEPGAGRVRMHRLDHGVVLVDDSYNSSPAALASVLDTMRASDVPGRRVLVMGDMLELGPMEVALHREAGKRAAAAGVRLLVTVGALAREAGDAARRAGAVDVTHHADARAAAEALVALVGPGDLIVVKGSRRMQLEQVVRALAGTPGEVH
jgi:UDP-N-acetylmuramyl pentapeptide synthase